MTKRKWKIGAAGVCAAVVLTAVCAAATGGNEGDPLVTLGYLKSVFTPQVQIMVDSAVAAGQAQSKADFDAAIQAWDEKISQAMEGVAPVDPPDEPATFASAAVNEGQTMSVQAGCEIIVRSGAPTCSAALLDQTDGTLLAAGQALRQNHLYLATGECALSVPTATVTGVVNAGPLNVRAGGGSSYDILGTIQQGTIVTIVDTSVSGWYMITGGGLAGYVSADYVDLNPTTVSGPANLLVRGGYNIG